MNYDQRKILREANAIGIAKDVIGSVAVGVVNYLNLAKAQITAAQQPDNPYSTGWDQAARSLISAVDCHNHVVGGLRYTTADRLTIAIIVLEILSAE